MFSCLLDGPRVVGCVGVTLHGPVCELHRLYLLSAYRGRGWGKRLLRAAMDFGRSAGCRRMIAWSDVVLTPAHELYRRTGFVQEGERICDDPDNSREYGFWKEPPPWRGPAHPERPARPARSP
jgi:GNAT superfamily N-acetyltransferase